MHRPQRGDSTLTHSAPEDQQVSETIEVTVRDRSAEAPWGVGMGRPVVRKVTISALCPKCGGSRGERKGLNQYDDGDHYWVQTWQNNCGHIDAYADVITEAEALASAQ